jgi:hypothetical protein
VSIPGSVLVGLADSAGAPLSIHAPVAGMLRQLATALEFIEPERSDDDRRRDRLQG